MKYAIDEIIGEIAVLENIDTKEKKEVQREELPSDSKEGNIVIFINNEYLLDSEEENKRRESLRERLNKIKRT